MPIKQIYICDKCGKETSESDLFLNGTFPGEADIEKVDQFDDSNMRCTFSFVISQDGDKFMKEWNRPLLEHPIICKKCIKHLLELYIATF